MKCINCNESARLVRAPGKSEIFYRKSLIPVDKKLTVSKSAQVALYPFMNAEDGLCYYCHKKSIGLFGYVPGEPLKHSLSEEMAKWLKAKGEGR